MSHELTISLLTLLYDLVFVLQKDNHYVPYPLDQVRHIAYQLCYAVNCKYPYSHHKIYTVFVYTVELVQSDTEFSDILSHLTKI